MEEAIVVQPGIMLGKLSTEQEIDGVLVLQKQNHRKFLDPAKMEAQGFVTATYTPQDLQLMNGVAPSVIAKNEQGQIIGYCLAKTPLTRQSVPELEELFKVVESISYDNKPLDTYRYLLVGQVCVAEAYRSIGLFDGMYQFLKKTYATKYEIVITEVAKRNIRSLKAHIRVGFEIIHEHYDAHYDDTWQTIVWDWRG